MIFGAGRRLLVALCAVSIGVASRAPHAPALALEGDLEAATTRIAVKLDDRLSSQESTSGDEFHFELTGSVMLDGVPVGAGTRGHGVVVDVRSGRGSERGSLVLAARSLDLPGGRHVPVGLAPGALDRKLTYDVGTRFEVISPPPQTPDPNSD